MISRPAYVVAADDQVRAAVREVTSGENVRRLYVIARNLDQRGSFEKAASVRHVINLLDGWAFEAAFGDIFDDDGGA